MQNESGSLNQGIIIKTSSGAIVEISKEDTNAIAQRIVTEGIVKGTVTAVRETNYERASFLLGILEKRKDMSPEMVADYERAILKLISSDRCLPVGSLDVHLEEQQNKE